MAAVFIVITLLFLFIFLMIGVASKFNKARHTLLYLTIVGSSLLVFIVVTAIYYSDEWKGLLEEGKDASLSLHSGKQKNVDYLKAIPVNEQESDSPVENLPEDKNPTENIPETPPQSNEESNPSREKINVSDDEIIDYTVVKGDGLWSIAIRSGVTVENLKQWNSLSSDVINIGQLLKIYGKNIAPPLIATIPDIPAAPPSILISHGSLQKKQIALTFDAGSDSVGIGILDVLKKHNVKATFFLTGKWVGIFPAYAKTIVNEGHSIGNHTYSHPDALKVSTQNFKSDIEKAEKTIKDTTGVSPRPYFRFPYGSYNEQALKVAGEAGYKYSFHWSIDTIDWKQPSTETIVNRIKDGASNGDIILMHIGAINTPAAVDAVIPILKAQGYELVTLDQMMN